jgi:hypothetical protein
MFANGLRDVNNCGPDRNSTWQKSAAGFVLRTRLAEFALKHHIAMVCALREQVVADGFMGRPSRQCLRLLQSVSIASRRAQSP